MYEGMEGERKEATLMKEGIKEEWNGFKRKRWIDVYRQTRNQINGIPWRLLYRYMQLCRYLSFSIIRSAHW